MNFVELKNQWLAEESTVIKGWDFSHLNGKWRHGAISWDYDAIVREHLKSNYVLLDMGTGGGEYIVSLNHPPNLTHVTEAYPPNVDLCLKTLAPMGIDVKQVFNDCQLPFEDELFDIIINRHNSFDMREVNRILKPNGIFITQQVGNENGIDLSKALIFGFVSQFPDHTLKNNVAIVENQGFDILFQKEDFPKTRFYDIGAVVYFAKAAVWGFPDFSVESCFSRLCALQEQLETQGFVENREHRFIIAARKPACSGDLTDHIKSELGRKGVRIVRFVDISSLAFSQTQGYEKAIVFLLPLSPGFIIGKRDGIDTGSNEFADKEHEADALADGLAEQIQQKGYCAYSQSEESNWQNGNFDVNTKSSNLPHKTIARLAGIGYIGKNNLLISEDYGCAFVMSTVLTDAPVKTESYPLVSSKCGDCNICTQICPVHAIHGNEWSESEGREAVVDVSKCTCTLKCMVNCPHTLNYALRPSQAL